MMKNEDNIKENIQKKKKILKKINPSPEDDPMINTIKGAESSEFKPIHTMIHKILKMKKLI